MYVRLLLLLLFSMSFTATSLAADKIAVKEGKPYAMEEMVITESKMPQSQDEVTHKIDVVTHDEIQNLGYTNRNVAETFKYLPGNFVNPLSRNDANWGAYGGLGPKYNGYLLDGLPIDSFVDTMSLDAIYLDHAELHRGPASVLYSNYMTMDFAGNQAPLAGISNLITKERISAPLTSVSLGYGSWNTLLAKLYHEGSKGDFHYFLGGAYEQSDYTNYGTTPSWLNMIDDPQYKKTKLYFKTTYFISPDSKISVFAHHTQQTGDAGRPNRGFDHQYDLINTVYENRLNKDLNLQFKLGYRYYDRTWQEDNFPVLSLREKDGVRQNIVPADLSFNYRHGANSLLTVGSDIQFATYETFAEVGGVRSKGNDMDAINSGLYIQEKAVLGDWVLRGGGRLNYTKHNYDLISGVVPSEKDKSWSRFLWSAGVRYNATKEIGLYANAGSSFLVPSARSVGGTLNLSDLGVTGKNGQLPNPGLKPEKGLGLDLGGDFWIMSNLRFGIRGFYNVIDDAIVENVVNTTPSQSQSINAGKSHAYGVEVELNQMISKSLNWFANATFTNTTVKNKLDMDQDGSDIPFVPNFMANIGLTAKLPYDIAISPYYQYTGAYFDSTSKSSRREFGKYGVVNVNAQKLLFKNASYRANLSVDLNNLFNNKYEMPWQFQDPGFNALAKVEITF
ncbi:MAG: TonB-dependent receptor [Thermodesulfovibrio sp.]|nr:TonB-dependent receptor [Thermodesulfovibrio sp.]